MKVIKKNETYMKLEFQLGIDPKTGLPVIRFTHYERVNDIQQNVLKVFIEKAKSNGIVLANPNGTLEVGTSYSLENYEIKIKGE